MKTNINLVQKMFTAASLLLLFSTTLSAETDCWVHRRVPPGTGTHEWKQRYQCCLDGGVDCIKEPCTTLVKGKITPVPSYGYALELQLDEVTLSVKDDQGNWNTFIRDGRNYFFTSSDQIEIVTCDDYPQLVGICINLNGIVTDSDGKYMVFIPSP
jgi:hypothetical protein